LDTEPWEVWLVRGILIQQETGLPIENWYLIEIGITGRGQYATLLSELEEIAAKEAEE